MGGWQGSGWCEEGEGGGKVGWGGLDVFDKGSHFFGVTLFGVRWGGWWVLGWCR